MNYKSKALTIAGSDSGVGAGIQADLKTFQVFNVYGISVIASITAQNTKGVKEIFGSTLPGCSFADRCSNGGYWSRCCQSGHAI